MTNVTFLSRSIFMVFALLQIFQLIEAQEICNNGRLCNNNFHCCSYRSNIICCRDNFRFWSQWYIWFAVVVFFLLLASCLVAYRRRQRFLLRQTSAPVTAAVIAQTHVTTGQPHIFPGQMVQNAHTPVITDAPPSYNDLKYQGIASQYQQKEYALPSASAPPYVQQSYPPQPPQSVDPPAPPYPGN